MYLVPVVGLIAMTGLFYTVVWLWGNNRTCGVPTRVPRTGDTADVGTGLRTPKRRPPKGELTARQKAGNRRVSRRRIVVEHGIGKMKVWRIAAERYRNPRRRHTLIIKNIAGLHNLVYA